MADLNVFPTCVICNLRIVNDLLFLFSEWYGRTIRTAFSLPFAAPYAPSVYARPKPRASRPAWLIKLANIRAEIRCRENLNCYPLDPSTPVLSRNRLPEERNRNVARPSPAVPSAVSIKLKMSAEFFSTAAMKQLQQQKQQKHNLRVLMKDEERNRLMYKCHQGIYQPLGFRDPNVFVPSVECGVRPPFRVCRLFVSDLEVVSRDVASLALT